MGSGWEGGGGTGSADGGRRLAFGVEGVTVEFVAVVVEERGREGIRDAGFVPLAALDGGAGLGRVSMLSLRMRSRAFVVSSTMSSFDRERDRERVRKLYILLSNLVRLEGRSSSACEQGNFISSDGLSWMSFILSSTDVGPLWDEGLRRGML